MTYQRKEQLSDDVTLFLGDCREVLPTLGKVDAVVTDPPYGLGKRMQGGTWGAQDHNSGFLKWDLNAPEWLPNLIAGIPSIVWGQLSAISAVPVLADLEQGQRGADHG
jgi:tRNA G10  N-methylase Trm11